MEDSKPKPPAPPPPPAMTPGEKELSAAFALSAVADGVPTETRTEHSIMEGLPAAKAERIAAMRRELADLQRQLTDAQQRVAAELQGRAEDAERIEVLEAHLQAHEQKAAETEGLR